MNNSKTPFRERLGAPQDCTQSTYHFTEHGSVRAKGVIYRISPGQTFSVGQQSFIDSSIAAPININ